MESLHVHICMRSVIVLSALCINLYTSAAMAEDPYQGAWSRQLGTTSDDISRSVTVDGAGNIFISGRTKGSLSGTNAGGYDAFLAKYDPAGTLLWTKQLGTNLSDQSWSVAVDGVGNAFISGFTKGTLSGTNAGDWDAFLTKYDPAGNLLWTEQLGTSNEELSRSVAVDTSGNAFISGRTKGSLSGTNAGGYDAYLSKYDTNGNLLWTEQLGTSHSDNSSSVAVDGAGNIFISGSTEGNLGGINAGHDDAFLSKYDTNGNLLWTEQLGTSGYDHSNSVVVDGSGNVFISGGTSGHLGGTGEGSTDAYLAKYDSTGNLLWTEQIGTSHSDYSSSVAVDGAGNIFISGTTYGNLGGVNSGGYDAFLCKYGPAGNLLWTEQLGTSGYDHSYSIVVDGTGNAFISGSTYGSLGGINAGERDAFLVKYAVPEPATLSLLALGGLTMRRRKS